MLLYHGSAVPNIKTLKPQQADHDRPYLYLSTLEIVAGFYMVNAVERPYYWFPYGFEKDGRVHYQEWYPDALKEVAEGKSGWIYTVDAREEDVLPFQNIPCAKLGTAPMPVVDCLQIPDCYEWLMEQEKRGVFMLKRYADKTPENIAAFEKQLVGYLRGKNMIENPDCSYAKFVQNKFPGVWADYVKQAQGTAVP